MFFFKILKQKRTPDKLGTLPGISLRLYSLLQRQKNMLYIYPSQAAILSLPLQNMGTIPPHPPPTPRTDRNKEKFRTQQTSKLFVDKTGKLMLQHNALSFRMPWTTTCPDYLPSSSTLKHLWCFKIPETTEKIWDEHSLSLINWSFLTVLQSSCFSSLMTRFCLIRSRKLSIKMCLKSFPVSASLSHLEAYTKTLWQHTPEML